MELSGSISRKNNLGNELFYITSGVGVPGNAPGVNFVTLVLIVDGFF